MFQILPRAAKSIRKLNDFGLRVFIVTNQGGIRHKDRDFTWEEYHRIDRLMRENLESEAGAFIDDVFICHHADYEGCSCRKPEIGLFEQARKKHEFEPSDSYIVGDSSADIVAGRRFGLRTILVESGWQTDVGEELLQFGAQPDVILADLWEAACHIIDEFRFREMIETK
jgi:histidinol-phosphate phosphatase family protein